MNKDLKYMPIDDKAGTFMSKHCSPMSYGTPLEKKGCSAANYGSPLDQKMQPGNVGYYDPEFEAHPSEKLPTRKENIAEIQAVRSPEREEKIKETSKKIKSINIPDSSDISARRKALAKRANLSGELYKLRKPILEAEHKMFKQKRKDYQTILKAGEAIGKSLLKK